MNVGSQPSDSFGRVYAVYGGIFIFLAYLWGWGVDGQRPDRGDWIGSSIALAGVMIALFWPRGEEEGKAVPVSVSQMSPMYNNSQL